MKKTYVAAWLLIALGLSSCMKEELTKPFAVEYLMPTVYGSLAVKPVTATIDAAKGGTVFGPNGSRFVFPPNAFANNSSASVSGDVQITVADFLKKGDMIFSHVLPITKDHPLVSGGEVFVSATQNGEQLRLNSMFEVKMPFKGNAAGMFLFQSEQQQLGDTVRWFPVDSSQGGGIQHNGDTIKMFSNRLGFCNADRFLDNPNYQTFDVRIIGFGILPTDQVAVYALYDEFLGVWPLNGKVVNNAISENHVPDRPVHFVVMVTKNGKFYGGMKSATPRNGGKYAVAISEMDPLEFKKQLDAL